MGQTLRAARERAGLSLRKAAKQAGISHAYLIRLESGERCPSVIVAAELIRALELSGAEAQVLWKDAVTDHGRAHPSRVNRP